MDIHILIFMNLILKMKTCFFLEMIVTKSISELQEYVEIGRAQKGIPALSGILGTQRFFPGFVQYQPGAGIFIQLQENIYRTPYNLLVFNFLYFILLLDQYCFSMNIIKRQLTLTEIVYKFFPSIKQYRIFVKEFAIQ